MGMFDNYNKLSLDYIPNNSFSPKTSDYEELKDKLPYPAKDFKGNFIGYSWNRGDTFDLVIDVSDTIRVRNNSIIYEKPGEHPTTTTFGKYSGHQAYNIVDNKSWTFVGKSAGLFIWVEDDVVTYPVDGEKKISLFTDMNDKTVRVDIYNFRWEHLHSFTNSEGSKIVCPFDEALSSKFIPGVYYAVVKVCCETSSIVKSKYTLIVK